ncbi:hypothetical protein [Paraburkholderia domus]|uniref:hypothetical protein n=1 Tax=Paraburkholderia domus TaxID=2793075 RepID=UPI001BAA3F03|nr:hypothetical protein [Paraburkholderia domus]
MFTASQYTLSGDTVEVFIPLSDFLRKDVIRSPLRWSFKKPFGCVVEKTMSLWVQFDVKVVTTPFVETEFFRMPTFINAGS